jgi:hypothetical protein
MPAHNASERAEQRALREQMRGLGMSRAEIADEMARRYRLRPRKAWRIAWGWTLEEAAERYNTLRARDSPEPVTALTGSRLSEWENWPFSTRKPPVTGLCLLAEIYQCGVLDLTDFHDRKKLPAAELLTLDKFGAALPADQRGQHRGPVTQRPPQPTRPDKFNELPPPDVLQPNDAVGQLTSATDAGIMPSPDARASADRVFASDLLNPMSGADRDNDPVRRRTFVGLTGTMAVSAILDPVPHSQPAGIEPLALVLVGQAAGVAADEAEPDLAVLTAAADQARRQYQACRYSGLIRHLPGLLSWLDTARQSLDGDDRLRAHALSADVHHVAAGLLLKLDDLGLACLAADKSMRAAVASQDPLAVAASARIVTHT